MEHPGNDREKVKVVGGKKRGIIEVIGAPYARYGVAVGNVQQMHLSVSCIILCAGWPSWAWAVKTRGWHIAAIIVQNAKWNRVIRQCFPDVELVTYGSDTEWKQEWKNVNCCLSDIDPPRKLNVWSEISHVVVTRRSARHLPAPWKGSLVALEHLECGGTTDGSWRINVYQRGEAPELSLPPQAYRDLSSLLDTMVRHGLACVAPQKLDLQIPHVIKIRPKTYHGGGLFPWGERDAYVVTTNVFSPTGWCRRRLTGDEMLQVLDVPDEVAKMLIPGDKTALIQDTNFLPLKCALCVVDMIPGMDVNSESTPKRRAPACFSLTLNSGWSRHAGDSGPSRHVGEKRLACPKGLDESITQDEATAKQDGKVLDVKAVKADDATVPEHLWDERICLPVGEAKQSLLKHLRTIAVCWWRNRVRREFLAWFQGQYRSSLRGELNSAAIRGHKAAWVDWIAGRECVRRCCDASWWEWEGGSRPLFWRWPEDYQVTIRDGLPLWFKGPLPRWTVPQRKEKDVEVYNAIRKKLTTVRSRGYIIPGTVKSLTFYFAVPKGDSDIRLVYDGTKSGLNSVLWAPWFPLPTVEAHLRAVDTNTFMGDLDIGEMFLNFMLTKRVRMYAGVDLTPYFPDEADITGDGKLLWEHWSRCAMGFTTSPYQTVQGIRWAEEVIRGDPMDVSNIFRWDVVSLNLPGTLDYDPSKPWVAKMRLSDGCIACDVFIYVDDARLTGNSDEECWQSSRQAGSRLNFLGIQDASRKRRGPSRQPGAWAGSIVHTSEEGVSVMISQERWDRARNIVRRLQNELSEGDELAFKSLESDRGFLVYVCGTYPAITPYLKGIHLTLDSWRPWRKEDGWKMSIREIRAAMLEKGEVDMGGVGEKAPNKVKAAHRLRKDLEALQELFSPLSPPKRRVRPRATAVALYGFGDASGKGFGSSLAINGVVHYRHGQWSNSYEEESSNYRELANLVYAVEESQASGLLEESELFLFTDNSTAESAFYKGTSSSEKLFELVLRLRRLQMLGGVHLHVIHVSGKRMMAQGTDGLSRGSLYDGIMKGDDLLSYVPLHLSALNRSHALTDWIHYWFGGEFEILTPEGWFNAGHGNERYVWAPPPAAADAAIDQLGQAKHKRPHVEHLVVIPRLMTSRWRKQLGKICDVLFTVPIGADCWNISQFEPLIVGIALPLSKHRPWRLRGTPIVERVEGLLRDLPSTDNRWGGDILRQFLVDARRLESLSESLVRPMLFGD